MDALNKTISNDEFRKFVRNKLDEFKRFEDPADAVSECKAFLDANFERMSPVERAETYQIIAGFNIYVSGMDEVRSTSAKGLNILSVIDENSEFFRQATSISAKLLNIMGRSYAIEGELFTAVNYLSKSFEKAILGDEGLMENSIVNNVGNIYLQIENYDMALKLFKMSVDLYNRKKDLKHLPRYEAGRIVTNINVALVYCATGDIQNAEKTLELIEEYLKSIKSSIIEYYVMDLRSALAEAKGDYETADKIYDELYRVVVNEPEGKALSEVLVWYFLRVFKRKNLNLDSLYNRVDEIQTIIDEDSTYAMRAQIQAVKLDIVLRMKAEEKFKKALNMYNERSKKMYEFYLAQQGKAVIEQYESMLIRKEKDAVDMEKLEAEYGRVKIQRERDSFKLDYDRLKFINAVARAARTSEKFEVNMGRLRAELSRKMTLKNLSIWIVNDQRTVVESYCVDEESNCEIKSFDIDELCLPVKEVLETRKIAYCGDYSFDSCPLSIVEEKNPSVLSLPVVFDEKIIAVMSMRHDAETRYNSEQIRLVQSILPYVSISVYTHKKNERIIKETEYQDALRVDLETISEKLMYISEVDGLTGIPNRRYYEAKLPFLLRKAIKDGSSLAIYMMDIDYFKAYNDKYGHIKGDEAIKSIAKTIDSVFSFEDAVYARYGGEEFIAVIKTESLNFAEDLASRILDKVMGLSIEHGESPIGKLTLSIGCAVCDLDRISKVDSAVKAADDLLYTAKQTGRNKVEIAKFTLSDT